MTQTARIKVANKSATASVKNSEVSLDTSEVSDVSQRHAFIPDKKYAKRYVHRKVDGVEDFNLLDWCMDSQRNLLMMGDTGAGKTMFPMAYAAANEFPYYTIPCDVSIDPSSLFGKMMPTGTVGKFEWVDGPVTELVKYGGVLNISEINFMPAKIAASLYSLLDHRRSIQLLGKRGEHVVANDRLLIVADMNPKYRGTVELNIALANRFAVKVAWGYEAAVERKLVNSRSLLDLVQRIRKEPQIRTPIGTNMMEEFEVIAGKLGVKFAASNFVNCFTDSEREPVKNMLDAASVNIATEIAEFMKKIGTKVPEDVPEELPADPSWFKEEDFDVNDYELTPAS